MFIKIYYDNFPVLEQVNLMVLLMVRMWIPFKYCAVETVADAVESVLLAKDFMRKCFWGGGERYRRLYVTSITKSFNNSISLRSRCHNSGITY